MKKFLVFALAVGLAFSVQLATANLSNADSIATYPVGAAAGGVARGRHNLGAFGGHFIATAPAGSAYVASTQTTEICVFCHTPHHADADSGPLWNRGSSAATYTIYGTSDGGPKHTVGGTFTGQPGGATLACLSCHDGTVNWDMLINRPGKGYNTNESAVQSEGANGGSQGYVFSEDGSYQGTAVNLLSGRLLIGTDLSDDHPVSITYNSDRASLRPTGTVISTIDLADGLHATNANIVQNLWAVNGYISDSATISDILRNGKVECSSCHDPHFSNWSWDEVEWTWGGEEDSDGLYLRRVGGNTGSGVCRTCHAK